MAKDGQRFFVMLDPYESRLLNMLHKDLSAQARARNRKAPNKRALISGCVRTAIHTVYGEDYAHDQLLNTERFRELMEEVNLGPDELGEEPA